MRATARRSRACSEPPWRSPDLVHKRAVALRLDGVRDFGVELNGVETAVFVGHAGDGARRRGAIGLKPGGSSGSLVAVAQKPDLQHAVTFGRGEVVRAFQRPEFVAVAITSA